MGELARTVMNNFGEFARILSHLNPVLRHLEQVGAFESIVFGGRSSC